MQDWLKKEHSSKNVFSYYFFSGILHLRSRFPLPFGENYSIIFENPSSTQLENLKLSSFYIHSLVEFFLDLNQGKWKDVCTRNGKEINLDLQCYFNLFCSARHPFKMIDQQYFSDSPLSIDYIVVLYKGNFFKLTIFFEEPITHEKKLRNISDIMKDLYFITNQNLEDLSNSKYNVALVTYLAREDAFQQRENLSINSHNKKTLKLIDESLFIVCLNLEISDYLISPSSEERKIFNYSTNGWYDKSLQLIVTNKQIGLNVEHSFADSGPVHTLASNVFSRVKSKLNSNYFNEITSCTALDSSLYVQKIQWIYEENGVIFWNNILIENLLKEKNSTIQSLIESSYDTILEGTGKDFFKERNVSPDSAFQMVLLLALDSYCTDSRNDVPSNFNKYPFWYNLETVDSRNYYQSRLILISTFNETLCQFLIHYRNGNLDQARALFRLCCIAHRKMLQTSQTYYLHLGLFLTNELKLNDGNPHSLSDDPIFGSMFHHDLISSNLGVYTGIHSVYSGHPPELNLIVVGYIIESNIIRITLTHKKKYLDGIIDQIKEKLELVKAWLNTT